MDLHTENSASETIRRQPIAKHDFNEIQSLKVLEDTIWQSLYRATTDRSAPFRTATFATLATSGSEQLLFPSMRTVVLRTVNIERRELSFNSDNRSVKIDQIESAPQISWLFYDRKLRTQLRLRGVACIASSGNERRAAWDLAQKMSRRCYCITQTPGSVAPDGPTTGLSTAMADGIDHDFSGGFENFARITTTITHIDWLYLSKNGNHRAQFNYTPAKTAFWVYP